jgi:NAD(P)-dependent dehydrogenase (short-subunit alcohol dehydrogenase family)
MSSSPKVAIVTGAGTGIGKAVALAFLKDGYRVVLAGRRSEPLEKAIVEAGAPKGSALAVPTDVADPGAVGNLFARTRGLWCRLDVLFNNGVRARNQPGRPHVRAMEERRRHST